MIRKLSYLKLLDDIRQEFTKLIDSSLNTLLYFPAIQTGYVSGSLLIVSLANKKVDEVYRLKIDDKTITLAEILSELEQDTPTVRKHTGFDWGYFAVSQGVRAAKVSQSKIRTRKQISGSILCSSSASFLW